MILVYETPGCLSCRKAKAWLEEKNLPYSIKNVLTTTLRKEELKRLFAMADDIYDLISNRSTAIKELMRSQDIEDMSFNELLSFIQQNPTALKRPILTDGKHLVVGWDEEEITVLLPRSMRYSTPGTISL